MWQELAIAVSLVLVLEGILPFLSPDGWRRAVLQVVAMNDRSLRIAGLVSMLTGTALLYLVH